MIDPTIQYSIAGAFALLFACSGVEKLRQLDDFAVQLNDYALLPASTVSFMARTIGLMEITAATLLITQYFAFGAMISVSLLLLYAIAISVNLLRGRTHIDCGCQLRNSNGISWFLVSRNAFMACLVALCILPGITRNVIWLDYVVIIFCVISAGLVYVIANLLITHHHEHRNWWHA